MGGRKARKGLIALESSESDLQIALVEYLRLFERQRGFTFFSVPNEAMGKIEGAAFARIKRLQKMGLRSGVSDLIIIHDGKIFCLELKARDGRQSETQIEFEADVNRAGGKYAVAYSFEEAVKILREWSILA